MDIVASFLKATGGGLLLILLIKFLPLFVTMPIFIIFILWYFKENYRFG